MADSEEFVGVAGIGAAVGDKRHGPAALGGGVVDSHKAASNAFVFSVPGDALVFDQVDHLHDQTVFAFQAVMDGGCFPAGKFLHHLKHRAADASRIDADT